MKIRVRYTAVFEKVIEVQEPENMEAIGLQDVESEFSDEIADIEPGSGEYQENTWEVDSAVVVDFEIENHGSIIIFKLYTQAIKDWVKENVQIEDHMWRTDGFHCESRYASQLMEGMESAGFDVS